MEFVRYIPRPLGESASTLDFNSLDALGKKVREDADPAGALHGVAQQFEALLIQLLLKQARQASGIAGLLDSPQVRLAQEMGDAQAAQHVAGPGMGIAQALMQQLRVVGQGGSILSAIEGAPRHVREFVAAMGSAACAVAKQTGLPERLVLGQAALESGWGRREIRHEDGSTSHNLFGVKANPGWRGKVVNVLTTEIDGGQARKVVQAFRAYDSYEESFADYARLISGNIRYRAVLQARSAEDAAWRIQEAGYATDPDYARKLISIMGYFDGAADRS